jgi:hypothetical protein
MSNKRKEFGTPLPEAQQALVREVVSKLGERAAAEALGVSDRTLVRCAAGFPVYRGTHALVREALRARQVA